MAQSKRQPAVHRLRQSQKLWEKTKGRPRYRQKKFGKVVVDVLMARFLVFRLYYCSGLRRKD